MVKRKLVDLDPACLRGTALNLCIRMGGQPASCCPMLYFKKIKSHNCATSIESDRTLFALCLGVPFGSALWKARPMHCLPAAVLLPQCEDGGEFLALSARLPGLLFSFLVS